MEDQAIVSSTSQQIFVTYLDHRCKSNPMIPAKFFSTYIKSKNQPMKLELTSDASNRTWEVKLEGRRFGQGWEDFSAVHSLRDDDVLTFRDNGDMTFHVTASGRRFRELQCTSSKEDDDDVRVDSKKIASKKKPKKQVESSSENSYLVAGVTSSNISLGTLRLPKIFVIKNGINKGREIFLVDKDGGKWSSGLGSSYDQGGFYLAKGWRRFATANGLKAIKTFTLEFVGVEGTSPMLKFCSKSKVKIKQAPLEEEEEEHAREDTETRYQKRARISAERPSRCTAASKKFSADPKNLKHKKPHQTSSISDQVAKVKQSIVDILTSVRQFRSELQIKAQNLEASLQETDALDLM